MIPSLLLTLSWTSVAHAGAGPWTLPAGATNLYLGLNQVQFETLRTAQGDTDLGGGVATVTAVAIGTLGLFDGAELEVVVPWSRANHRALDSTLCTDPNKPRDFCKTTEGISNLQLRLKGRFLDEGALQPVTLSVVAAVRSSEPTSAHRNRLTAIGDGQTDLGLQVSAGRTANVLDNSWYRTSLTLGYWRRLALEGAGADKVPADEVDGRLGAIVSPMQHIALGPVASGFYRLGGTEFAALSFDDPNAFPSLASAQIKVGGELAILGDDNVTVSLGGMTTVWARNNPSDSWVLAFGIGWYKEQGWHTRGGSDN